MAEAVNSLNAAPREPAEAAAGSFVLPDRKIAYVANPGRSDTAVKWLLAELSGQDLDVFHRTRRPVRTRSESIHVRASWHRVPTLDEHLGAGDARSLADDGWYVFTFVDEPRSRLWTTWQLRYLAGDPHLPDELFERTWFPREPSSAGQVVEDFARFVRALAGQTPDPVPVSDALRPQNDLVYREGLRYTQVYAPTELDAMRSDLDQHLAGLGAAHPAVAMPAIEPLPLPLVGEVLANGTGELIDTVYSSDVDRFGAAWPDGPAVSTEAWDVAALSGLSFQRAAHRRIRDVSGIVTTLAADLGRIDARVTEGAGRDG